MLLFRRPLRALTTWPDRRGWQESMLIALAALTVMRGVAAISGLLTLRPDLSRLSLVVFVVPAFTEELLFRAVLPGKGDTLRPFLWLSVGVVAFTLWHVVEATTFLPGARLFLRPGFLVTAAVLGAACAVMRYRTGSLWPGVVVHGVVVMAWQVLFAGPTLSELR